MDVKHMVMSMAAAGAAGVRRLGRRGNRVSPVLDGDWETQLGGGPGRRRPTANTIRGRRWYTRRSRSGRTPSSGCL